MRVLIVEDDDSKISRLRDLVEEIDDGWPIEIRKSMKSGAQALLELEPELLLLDMTIPASDEDSWNRQRFRIFGGADSLRVAQLRDIDCRAIVVTQHERFGEGEGARDLAQLRQLLETEFAQHCLGVVHFSPTEERWRTEIREMIVACTGLIPAEDMPFHSK